MLLDYATMLSPQARLGRPCPPSKTLDAAKTLWGIASAKRESPWAAGALLLIQEHFTRGGLNPSTTDLH